MLPAQVPDSFALQAMLQDSVPRKKEVIIMAVESMEKIVALAKNREFKKSKNN